MPVKVRDWSRAQGMLVRGASGTLKAALVVTLMIVAACTSRNSIVAPSQVATTTTTASENADHSNHNSASDAQKGYIDGWFDGHVVQLYYTKWFFCEEPPSSAATTDCEIGAPAQVAPRPGPIPNIYAIAAAGISPDPSTLACKPGTTCLNHPGMIDASRVGGSATASGVPHSHIVTERHAGWFNTVNIRVRDLAAWNEIAAAKRLEKVRELQANPAIVTADAPTNIYFFIASWRD